MSRASVPTIPFVLPLYENLQKHLATATVDRTKLPLKIRQGAAAGLEKLLKYKRMAENHHFYQLGTSVWTLTHVFEVRSTNCS